MATSADTNARVLWPNFVTKVFIDLMVDEFTKGNMPNGIFPKRTWNSIADRLNSMTNRSYSKDQLVAKMNRLRAMYREFNLLLQHIGFGWDAEANTVTASEEVWKNYIKVHDKASQFQKKGCEHYKLLGMLFSKNSATGVLHHSSTQDPPDTDEENELDRHYINTESGKGSHMHLDNDSSDDDIQEVEGFTPSRKRKSQGKAHKSKRESTSSQMGEALAAWAEASKARTEKYKSVDSPYSAAKCVTGLGEIQGISVDTYMKALDKFKDPEWREMFIVMPNDMKLEWLERL